ncbi:MAG: RNA polymerase sigma factor [Verrucomicrobia bacterium]|nr:RNA polymerase sigma factor [Verrucomicrobiota bacterium]
MQYDISIETEAESLETDVQSPDSSGSNRTSPPLDEVDLDSLESYVTSVHHFVARRVNNPWDAQDIAQQCLLLASAKLDSFRGENFQAWLFSIARNLVVDYYRGHDRRQSVEMDEAVQLEAEPALQTEPECVQSLCDSRERLRCWVSCISQRLRLEQQIALLLADVHGYRDKESAAELGVTVPCFKLLLHGARADLREIAGNGCGLVPEKSADAATAAGTGPRSSVLDPPVNCPLGPLAGTQSPPSSVRCSSGLKCCQHVPRLLRMRRELIQIFDLADGLRRETLMAQPELS